MIKCEVVEDFRLENFKELKNIVRKNVDIEGRLYVGDTFECSEEMAKYLDGGNVLKKKVIKIIEVKIKEEQDAKIKENAPIEKQDAEMQKTSKKKKTKKDNK